MAIETLAIWHQLVRDRNVKGLDTLLSDDVVFYSPVVDTPLRGKVITLQNLTAAFRVFFEGSFRYVREVSGDRDAVLEFQAEIDGVSLNGVDMITWDDAGKIVEFKVMMRPLKAIRLMHQKVEAVLER